MAGTTLNPTNTHHAMIKVNTIAFKCPAPFSRLRAATLVPSGSEQGPQPSLLELACGELRSVADSSGPFWIKVGFVNPFIHKMLTSVMKGVEGESACSCRAVTPRNYMNLIVLLGLAALVSSRFSMPSQRWRPRWKADRKRCMTRFHRAVQ